VNTLLEVRELSGFSFDERKERDWLPFEWKTSITELVRFRVAPDYDLADIGLQFGCNAEMRKHWLKVLPNQQKLKYLKIIRGNQQMFEQLCTLPSLERLQLEMFGLIDFRPIEQLKRLTHFHLNGSPKLESFSPLLQLPKIKSLGIFGKFPLVKDLNFIAGIEKLQALSLVGQDFYTQKYQSLAPISDLQQLRSFSLAAVRPEKDGLRPIAKLTKLEFLELDPYRLRQWSIKDYQAIYEGCPNLTGDLIKLLATDKAFQKKHKVR
jgi:hypothetical protein